jgi:hypothetical protein
MMPNQALKLPCRWRPLSSNVRQHMATKLPFIIDMPHIPLGVALAEGLAILRSIGNVEEEFDRERCYSVRSSRHSAAIYEANGVVSSVWYDDPLGRQSDDGRKQKVSLYLARYGALENWQMRMNNGWMEYWFNPEDRAAMVYGIHKDVIRFNQHDEAAA